MFGLKEKVGRELIAIIGLGVCCMLLLATENTLENMQKTVVSSIADDKSGFTVDGYTVTGIKFALSCFVCWVSPYINYVLGPRLTMGLASVGFLFHVVSFITEDAVLIYVGAVAVGVAEASFWPAEGRYLIENSAPENLNRNMAITLFCVKSAYLGGCLMVYYAFYGQVYLNQTSRDLALYCLTVLNSLAVFSFAVLPRSSVKLEQDVSILPVVRRCWSMLWSPRMLWLSLSFCYNGLQLTFWQGVYSPSLGFTLNYGDSVKALVGLSGFFMSIGAVIACLIPLVFAGWIRRHHYGRFLLVLLGSVAQILGYVICILLLPKDAVFGNTHSRGLLRPSLPLAMLGSTLLCFGDSCLFIQHMSILGDMYRGHGAEAIALYRFIMNVFAAMSYFYSDHINLHMNCGICVAAGLLNILGFYMADRPSPAGDEESKTAHGDTVATGQKIVVNTTHGTMCRPGTK